MASMALLNGVGHTDSLVGTCYLPSSSSNGQQNHPHHLTYSSPSQSPPAMTSTGGQRIAPKLPTLIQQQHRFAGIQDDTTDLMRCKRRIQLGQFPAPSGKGGSSSGCIPHQPAAVARRNERERNRVRLVNLGFATLRQHVPSTTKNKKMSKVDTLKSAVEYIKSLQELLGETTSDENSYPSGGRGGGQSSTGSPTPSVCSEASSPYDVVHGDEEDELIDFASWF